MRDYPARNCSTERTINFILELHICARYYKHATQTRFSRTVRKGYTPETSCYYSQYETFDICDLRRENVHWWLSVFKRLSVYKPFVSTVRTAWSPVRWNSPFEWLPHRLVRNIKPFKRLGHPFVEDIRPFERLGHLYSGIPLNFLSNDIHGRRVTLFVQKNSLVRAVI